MNEIDQIDACIRLSSEIHPSLNGLIAPREPASILFVDDDELVRRSFVRDLRNTDVNIVLAHSGLEGLNILKEHSFHIIVSDYSMPGMDGVDFLENVAEICPDSSRILISGRDDVLMVSDVVNRVGLFGFISKPWDREKLRETLRRALDSHQITKEHKQLVEILRYKCDELTGLTKRLEFEVHDRTSNLLFGLNNALDLRDTETQWHSRRVSVYARRLAMQLGIFGDELLVIERGALLHDVGKIGVSDNILLKPGKLTAEEWREMQKHSEYGYHILEKIEFLGNARELVRAHHERWDGGGYPRGLSKEDIYVGARIFAVIDTYDAMTSDRPYRKALSHEIACKEIDDMTGSQFDPYVVAAWKQIDKREILTIRESVRGDAVSNE